MSAEVKKEIQLEIAHVLFIDIVGYSKLSINEQRAAVDELNEVVRTSEQFRKAEAAARLIKIPTGDGMALVFYTSPEAPAQCAIEISGALKEHPRLQLRMGVHSGPVSGVIDVNGHANLAGAGLNIAQRVMACGDAGHILLSKRVAEDLGEYEQWRPHLHDLGACEVKHGMRISIVSLYADQVGNAQLPKKFQALKKHRVRLRWAMAMATLLALAAIIAGFVFFLQRPVRPSPAVPDKSIAVLPFENLSKEEENAFFADGVQDEILTDLAKVADLKVISRSSVMQYRTGVVRNMREIAKALGVIYLLEGSVQRAGGKVRINAQLIDARSDAHLWAQTFDRDLEDVFAIQSEIAKAIAGQLQAKLSPSEKAAIEQPPTTDLPAFDLYTRAKTLILSTTFTARAKDNLLQAVELLNQAVARDPKFLLAYCNLASAHDYLYIFGLDHTPGRLALGEAAVNAALRLQPDSGDAHLALAQYLLQGALDYDRARAEIVIALRILPNAPRAFELAGYIDRRQGRWDDSTRNLKRAIELDPCNLHILYQISLSYQQLRRYAEMAAALDRALAIVPKDVQSRVVRAQVDYHWRAETRPFHAMIDAILAEDPAAAPILADNWLLLAFCERDLVGASRALAAVAGGDLRLVNAVRFSRAFAEGLMARVRGDPGAARVAFTAARAQQEELVRTQPDYAPALCVLGLIDAALGRNDEALREGRKAVELMPVTRDAVTGSDMVGFFAITCAWTGEKDLALKQLAIATQIPSSVSYGQLRLHPLWDPLRGDPRFEKIVASLAPKADK